MSTTTYLAVEASAPGELNLVTRPLTPPGAGKVRIRIEACGICHSDCSTVEGLRPGSTFPRVPGHEVVGVIDALGSGVSGWQVGRRVGVGFLDGYCGQCTHCRRGDYVACRSQNIIGLTCDGGYAEMIIADARGLVAIPDGVTSADAAPFLCAGVTTFNALRNAPARAGDLVAVHGIGGLGHLAVQFARRMGFRVAAIARGKDKEALALSLGAHCYINSQADDPAAALRALGGAKIILATVAGGKAISRVVGGLQTRGRLIVLGAGAEPIEISPFMLLNSMCSIEGAVVGSPVDCEDTLSFGVAQSIKPIIECVPLTEAPAAYAKMMRNEARFRMVLVTSKR